MSHEASLTRRSIRLAACVLVCAAALVACVSATAASHARTSSLTVAILVPKAGFFTVHNSLIANGAEIAADESGNPNGLIGATTIDLVREQYGARTRPATLMRRLASKGITTVILPCDVNQTSAFAKAGQAAGMLMLLPCDPNPRLPEAYANVWPTAMAGTDEAAQLVNYAHIENATTGYILTARGSSYVTALTKYFRKAASLDHVKILGQSSINLRGPNLAAVAAELKRKKPRAIFTAIFSPYLEPIIAGLRKKGVELESIYGTDGLDAQEQLSRYGDALNGLTFGSFGFPRPNAEQFLRDYRRTFKNPVVGSFPGLGYETIHILEQAIAHADGASPTAISAAFAHGFSVTGVALEDVVYGGKHEKLPETNAGASRIVYSHYVALFSSDPTLTERVPAA